MTKQQKARAHLARAQELIQDTLGFGVINTENASSNASNDESGSENQKGGKMNLKSLPPAIRQEIISNNADGKYLSMLMMVSTYWLSDIKKILEQRTQDDKCILAAIDKEDMCMVYLLVKYGLERSRTYMILMALQHRNEGLLKALLKGGQYKYLEEKILGDHTALSYAALYGNFSSARILIDYGADVNVVVQISHTFKSHLLDIAIHGWRAGEIKPQLLWTPYNTMNPLEFIEYILIKGSDPKRMSPATLAQLRTWAKHDEGTRKAISFIDTVQTVRDEAENASIERLHELKSQYSLSDSTDFHRKIIEEILGHRYHMTR